MPERPPDTVITGAGAVSSFGWGREVLWSGVRDGRTGIHPVARFPTEPFSTALAGMLPSEVDEPPGKDADRFVRFAIHAIGEALSSAGFSNGRTLPPSSRIAIILGASIEQEDLALHRLVEHAADHFGIAGPRITISVACASATVALGIGRDLLTRGRADLVLAGGADALNIETFAGFSALGVLSQEPCAPYSTPIGTTLGEGAGIFVLERRDAGGTPLAVLRGHGMSADAFHPTAPDPRGAGVERSIRAALADARTAADQIRYVNAHATGTQANDPAEYQALQRIFLEQPREDFAVSGSKSIVGHAQGAAGALEALITIECMRRGQIPQTLHFDGPRPGCPDDPVAPQTPREARCDVVVCTNSAFGGANAAVVLARPDVEESASRASNRRKVSIRGLSAIGPFGPSIDDFAARPDAHGRVPEFRLADYARRVDPRTLYPSSKFLIVAAVEAFADAGIRPRGEMRERTGFFAAIDRLSPSATAHFRESVDANGISKPSTRAFANMVVNAPAGACARALTLRGPHNTLSAGPAGGLLAVILAADHLAHRDDADVILAGACNELPTSTPTIDDPSDLTDIAQPFAETSEGAACAVLQARDAEAPEGSGWECLGWGIAGPHDFGAALGEAMAMAGEPDIGACWGPDDPAFLAALDSAGISCEPTHVAQECGAVTSLLNLVAGARQMRDAGPRCILLATTKNNSTCGALILRRSDG